MPSPIIEQIAALGIIPVVVIDNPENAAPLAAALQESGLPCMEITFRTEGAAYALKNIASSGINILLGAGTVLTKEQAAQAIDAGAQFIVAPGLNRKIADFCLKKNVAFIPGVATPTEIETALDLGIDTLKLFPAEALGGIEYLKSLSSPYKVKFIPTGGINQQNLNQYLKQPNVVACGGSWMVRSDLIQNKYFNEIKVITSAAIDTMLGFELKHIGINCSSAESALAYSQELDDMLHLSIKEGSSSVFVGSSFEFTKKPFLGRNGHIAIGTNSISRAIYYLEKRGYRTLPDSKVIKDGKLIAIYLEKGIAGFALHLLQN